MKADSLYTFFKFKEIRTEGACLSHQQHGLRHLEVRVRQFAKKIQNRLVYDANNQVPGVKRRWH